MRERETDVVVVGAGGDGPALAWRLGQLGVDVTILEAGPFYGNEEWPAPNDAPGGEASGDPDDTRTTATKTTAVTSRRASQKRSTRG